MKKRVRNFFKKISSALPQPNYTRLRNLNVYSWLNKNGLDKLILNLGSGVGTFDHNLAPAIKTINLDISPGKPNLDIIGDAHLLPLKAHSIDIVYCIAVLEHIKKPWIVAEEIYRILRPGGFIVLELPFLNVIHDEHDYYRFTDKGIRVLFDQDRYDIILKQTSSGGGSFLSLFLLTYVRQFVPTKSLKYLWTSVMGYPFSLCKYLDFFIDHSPELRLTANSFSFIGKKR
jgi:ubiquinone/menaquinone biosynthesis C-methylase UbiE